MKPLQQTLATADVLIEVAGKLKSPIALPWKTAEEVAKSGEPVGKSTASSVGSSVGNGLQAVPNQRDGLKAGPYKYKPPTFDGDSASYTFHFLPYLSPQIGHG